jgi:hypothetical protein
MITGKAAGLQILMEEVLQARALQYVSEVVLHCLLTMTLYMLSMVFLLRQEVSTEEETHCQQLINNIESISVLKDAQPQLWISRFEWSNIITTKKKESG